MHDFCINAILVSLLREYLVHGLKVTSSLLEYCCNLKKSSWSKIFVGVLPTGAFQQPAYNKSKVWWLRVLARMLNANLLF